MRAVTRLAYLTALYAVALHGLALWGLMDLIDRAFDLHWPI